VGNTPDQTVRIHVQTPDWTIQSAVTVPRAPAPIEAWMPLLQGLASRSAQAAADAAAAEGKTVSCAKGCGACCRQLVAITLVEARALARLVAEMPLARQTRIRRRFSEALQCIAQSGVAGRDCEDEAPPPGAPLAETGEQRLAAAWFALRVACPFLEDESCGIHQDRPLTCREYLVTSPAATCERLFREPVDRLNLSTRSGAALARAAARIADVPVATIPLVTALQLPSEIDAALSQPRDMIAMLEVILAGIGDWRIDPVQRPAVLDRGR
jgi:Fe-S-cluster containining protein